MFIKKHPVWDAFFIFATMRKRIILEQENITNLKRKLVSWSKKQDVFIFLDSNDFNHSRNSHDYDFIAAFGVVDDFRATAQDAFDQLEAFFFQKKDWLFGHLTYDLKNGLEELSSTHADYLDFPGIYFFQPQFVIFSKKQQVEIQFPDDLTSNDARTIIEEIQDTPVIEFSEVKDDVHMNARFDRHSYLETVKRLKQHIKRGDIYEVNFCQEFFSESKIDPYFTFDQLNQLSPAPFASFYRLGDKYLMSSSPERFLKKSGDKVISQPIKGTVPRGESSEEDEKLKDRLARDVKERTENVMIVDLVRNDLSRTARTNSVTVDELFGIYSFEHVHQMISTVSAEIEEKNTIACLKHAFPMGSMTGAPKIRAMELIEQYERSKRGLYSGSVGYFTPEGDFDFNVIIRSILYNATNNFVSYSVGGAITYLCDAEAEYDECLVKAKAMNQVLNQS